MSNVKLYAESGESYNEYQQFVKERANSTINELHEQLLSPTLRIQNQRQKWTNDYYSPEEKISAILNKKENQQQEYSKNGNFRYSLGRKGYSINKPHNYDNDFIYQHLKSDALGELPSSEEAFKLLQTHAKLNKELEAKNAYIEEECNVLKQKMISLVEENKHIRQELKENVVHDISHSKVEDLANNIKYENSLYPKKELFHPMSNDFQSYGASFMNWKQEVQQLSGLHSAQISRVENQLIEARYELKRYETENEDLKTKLRFLENTQTSDANILMEGVCINCSQNAILINSPLKKDKNSIEKLTKERDELVTKFANLQQKFVQAQKDEEEMYAKVVSSVKMVESSQLELTESLLEKEQLKESLSTSQVRMEETVNSMIDTMMKEKELTRSEFHNQISELKAEVRKLDEKIVHLQLQNDRLSVDKCSLLNELETCKDTINGFDEIYIKSSENVKLSIINLNVEKEACLAELKKAKTRLKQKDEDYEAETQRLKLELSELRCRLDSAEQNTLKTGDQCTNLISANQSLERDIHAMKLAKDTLEKNRTDDVKMIQKQAEQREIELNVLIENMDARHGSSVEELDDILSCQRNLTQKLQSYCKQLTKALDTTYRKYKSENKNLKIQNQYLKTQVNKTHERVDELEEQNAQYANLHTKMRERIHEMDGKAQSSSIQNLELLSRDNLLTKEKLLLVQEVDGLRERLKSDNNFHQKE